MNDGPMKYVLSTFKKKTHPVLSEDFIPSLVSVVELEALQRLLLCKHINGESIRS